MTIEGGNKDPVLDVSNHSAITNDSNIVYHTEEGILGRYNKDSNTIEATNIPTAASSSSSSDGLRRRQQQQQQESVEQPQEQAQRGVTIVTPSSEDDDAEKGTTSSKAVAGSTAAAAAAAAAASTPATTLTNNELSVRDNARPTVERGLGGDSYSLFFIYKSPLASTFMYAMAVFLFQVAIFTAFLTDIIDMNTTNPLRIPPGCSTPVRISQTFALMVALLNNGEIVGTIANWNDGYKNMVFANLPPHANQSKWLLMTLTHFIEGLLALTVNFILIIQSTEAKPLFLSLSATAIISKVDDLTFAIASLGYVTRSLQTKTEQVNKVKVTSTKVKTKTRIIFCLIYLALLAGWGVVVALQRQGKYVPDTIALQFGTYEHLGYNVEFFSGPYDIDKDSLKGNKRATYLERRFDNSTYTLGRGKVFYCEEEEAWVFAIEPVIRDDSSASSVLPMPDNKCNWLLRSKKTESYDVSKFPTASSWTLWIGRHEPVPFFRLGNVDCYDRSDCFGRGECDTESRDCLCDAGWMGLKCQFAEPCKSISTLSDQGLRLNDVPNDQTSLNKNYTIGEDKAKAYGRYIYVYEYPDDVSGTAAAKQFDIIYYTGRRWFATKKWLLNSELETMNPVEQFKNYHAQWNNFFLPYYVSEDTNGVSPEGLKWFRYRAGGDPSPIPETVFTCSECTKGTGIVVDSCTNGECLTTSDGFNQCDCVQGYSGPGCDVPPTEDSISSVYITSLITFDYDDTANSCGLCFWVTPLYDGDCIPFPYTDPITIGNTKTRFALGYDGTVISVYAITDNALFNKDVVDVKSRLFQIEDSTLSNDFYLYQREMCNPDIATLVGTIQPPSSVVGNNATTTTPTTTVVSSSYMLDETGTVSVMVDNDTSLPSPSDNDAFGTVFLGNSTCDPTSLAVYDVDVCYIPGSISERTAQSKKAWFYIAAEEPPTTSDI